MSRLWIRADASPEIGLGHLMRTWAVAEAAESCNVPVTYATTDNPSSATFIRNRTIDVRSISEPADTSWYDHVQGSDIVLFDGYDFSPEDYASARRHCRLVAAIDDEGRGEYPVDLLISPTASSPDGFKTPEHCNFLLGPAFALVRSEFRDARPVKLHRRASVLIVTLGGSDPHNATERIAGVLRRQDSFDQVVYVQGPLQRPIQLSDDSEGTILRDPMDFAQALSTASAVLSAAGNTAWEVLTMGLPVALIETAGNQRRVGLIVSAQQAGFFLGRIDEAMADLADTISAMSDFGTRETLAHNATELVDGLGAQRILARLTETK